MKRSPDRNSFQAQNYINRCKKQGEEPRKDYLDIYQTLQEQDLLREHDDEWKKHNLEYDLRSTEWICAKARASQSYAQNIYAAMCNQDWQRNDVWPRLANQTWSCSWRYAGGIVADMVESGDYIDWYCSGIREQEALEIGFVPEGTITEEIREDLFRLGWLPVESKNQDDY